MQHSYIGSRSANISWDPVTCTQRRGHPLYYTILAVTADTGTRHEVALNKSGIEFEVGNLKPYRTYDVRVSLVNSAGHGPDSGQYLIYTLQDGKSSTCTKAVLTLILLVANLANTK